MVSSAPDATSELDPQLAGKERKRALLYLGAVLALLCAGTAIAHSILDGRLLQRFDEAQRERLDKMTRQAEMSLAHVQTDLSYLSQTRLARRCFDKDNADARDGMASLMSAMMQVTGRYDQLRLLDMTGHEVVRVNAGPSGKPRRVADEELQNKRGRYYFSETLARGPGEAYLSRFDLNQEHGRVEEPRKPMLRFGRVIASEQGEKLGIAIVNFLGASLLAQVAAVASDAQGRWYLVDAWGYYLRSVRPTEEFTFMFPEAPQRTFGAAAPNAWRAMQESRYGVVDAPAGRFHHATFAPLGLQVASAEQRRWTLVTQVPEARLAQAKSVLRWELLAGFLLVGSLLSGLAWKLGRSQVRQAWFLGELERSASVDGLTGLLNHRTAVAALGKAMALARRQGHPLTVAFVDVNDLKRTNDSQGHEAGDRMLRGAATALETSLRESDTAARLGGDEFLVILPDCAKTNACDVLERAERTFLQLGRECVGGVWTLSWGCAELEPKYDTTDALIRRADERMYEHKRAYKAQRKTRPARVDSEPPRAAQHGT